MKILFVENRGKTYTYEQVAKVLEQQGHQISWIIYNHAIKVDCGSVNIIPYPKKNDLVFNNKILDQAIHHKVKQYDRYVIYYGRDINHYPYYLRKIEDILGREKPDVVFGEVSTFYCIMCYFLCKQKNIPMYVEAAARYPRGRFAFHLPDRYRRVSYSNETISFADAKLEWEKIANRESKPDYLDRFSFGLGKKIKLEFRKDVQRLRYFFEYLKGEKFYTRSLLDTFFDSYSRRKYKFKWNSIARRHIYKEHRFVILYPMQKQPEFNLDVWGVEFRDQVKTIVGISESLPEGAVLYVKSSIVFNIEVSEELIDVIDRLDNVFCLDSSINMDEVFDNIDMLITGTGTVSIEGVLASKPTISLAETVASKFTGCVVPSSFVELNKLILKAMTQEFPLANNKDKYNFYSYLLASSYRGVLNDYTRTVDGIMKKSNLELLVLAYTQFLDQLSAEKIENW